MHVPEGDFVIEGVDTKRLQHRETLNIREALGEAHPYGGRLRVEIDDRQVRLVLSRPSEVAPAEARYLTKLPATR